LVRERTAGPIITGGPIGDGVKNTTITGVAAIFCAHVIVVAHDRRIATAQGIVTTVFRTGIEVFTHPVLGALGPLNTTTSGHTNTMPPGSPIAKVHAFIPRAAFLVSNAGPHAKRATKLFVTHGYALQPIRTIIVHHAGITLPLTLRFTGAGSDLFVSRITLFKHTIRDPIHETTLPCAALKYIEAGLPTFTAMRVAHIKPRLRKVLISDSVAVVVFPIAIFVYRFRSGAFTESILHAAALPHTKRLVARGKRRLLSGPGRARTFTGNRNALRNLQTRIVFHKNFASVTVRAGFILGAVHSAKGALQIAKGNAAVQLGSTHISTLNM